jgi:hypothetical protein
VRQTNPLAMMTHFRMTSVDKDARKTKSRIKTARRSK